MLYLLAKWRKRLEKVITKEVPSSPQGLSSMDQDRLVGSEMKNRAIECSAHVVGPITALGF